MSDPAQTDNRELHRRIGLAALQRNYVTVDVLADALLRAGQSPKASPGEIWITSQALDRTDWNVTQAARMLGVSRDTLRYRIEKHGLSRPER